MREFTFGNTEAAKIAIEILDTCDRKFSAKVSCRWHSYCRGMKGIMSVKDKPTVSALITMWRDREIEYVQKLYTGMEICTFLENMVVTRARMCHKKLQET